MAQCKKCKLFVSRNKDDGSVIKCKGNCGSYYHKKCVKNLQLFIDNDDHCENCCGSPLNPHKIDHVVNTSGSNSLLSELNNKLEIIYDMKDKLNELVEAVDFYAEKYQELLQQQEKAQKKIVALEQKNVYLEKYTKALEERINVVEGKENENKVEIIGLEKQEGEKIEKTIAIVAGKLNLNPENISSAMRVENKQMKQPSPVIVTLKNKNARDEWISKRKHRIDNNDIYKNGNTNPLYINEVLTKTVRQLLWMTKKELKGIYKYIWVQQGKILVKKGDTERKIYSIRSEEFLLKLKNDK